MKTKILRSLSYISLLLISALIIVSCQKSETEAPQQQDVVLKDIPTTLDNFDQVWESETSDYKKKGKKPSFSTLKVALAKTGLMSYVASNELTLFAPSDDAFAALGINKQNVGNVENLEAILLYHAVEGEVYAGDLTDGFYETLNGAAVEINTTDGVMVNDAQVIYADLKALNGVIHVIDAVLFPPSMNIVEIAISQNPDEFNTLVAAVVAAGLDDDLQGDGPFTVFAPTDAAFALLGYDADNIGDLPVAALENILKYHVIEGARVYSSDLTTGLVTMFNGDQVFIDADDLTVNGNSNTEPALLLEGFLNIQGTNGVIHVIDRVLEP
jgi:transforming growth factor-beta-induced protein